MFFCVGPLFRYAVLCVLSSFTFTLLGKRERELVALLSLSSKCHVAIVLLYLFLILPLVSLQFVIVAFHTYTHFRLQQFKQKRFHIFPVQLHFEANLILSLSSQGQPRITIQTSKTT